MEQVLNTLPASYKGILMSFDDNMELPTFVEVLVHLRQENTGLYPGLWVATTMLKHS